MTRGKSLLNNFTHKERGVAILIKKEIEINEVTNDKRGRILVANFYLHVTIFRIINSYGPNNPQKKENFLKSIEQHTRKCDTLILSGDFNIIENPSLDRQGGDLFSTNNTIGRNHLNIFRKIRISRHLSKTKSSKTRIYLRKA